MQPLGLQPSPYGILAQVKTPSYLLYAVLIIAPMLACRAATRLVYGTETAPPQSAKATPTATVAGTARPTDEVSCPDETAAILREADSENIPLSKFPSVDTGNNLDIPIVTYAVEGDQLGKPVLETIPDALIPYQNNFSVQRSAWNLFTALIPKEARGMLGQFQIMTDGPGGVLSAVEQTNEDPRSWILETDIADIPGTKSFAFTLLHEFGHLLTLDASQVPPDLQIFNDPESVRIRRRALAACPNYFPGEGCSLSKSYVNVFFSRFWNDLYDEWKGIDEIQDDIRRDAKLRTFYRKYHDSFVDAYAATSPSEDIAESWAYYILTPVPDGDSIMEQKLRFFDEYPELVRLRRQILDGVCVVKP